MDPRFEASVRNRNDMVLRRIDISVWNSPVSAQFHINSIPHLIVYNEDGVQINRGIFSLDGPLEKPSALWGVMKIAGGIGAAILMVYLLLKLLERLVS